MSPPVIVELPNYISLKADFVRAVNIYLYHFGYFVLTTIQMEAVLMLDVQKRGLVLHFYSYASIQLVFLLNGRIQLL